MSTVSKSNKDGNHSKPSRPTIHVQLDVKGQDPDEGGGGGNPDPTVPPYLRVSFSGTKRSDLSLFRASSPAVSGDTQVFLDFLFLFWGSKHFIGCYHFIFDHSPILGKDMHTQHVA